MSRLMQRLQDAYDNHTPEEFEPSPCPTCGCDSYRLDWSGDTEDCQDCYDGKAEDDSEDEDDE
jgi:hypothetical protein